MDVADTANTSQGDERARSLASQKLRDYLRDRGVSPGLLVGSDEDLANLGLEKAMEPGSATQTVPDIARQTGLTVDQVLRLRLALGFPTPEPGQAIASNQDVQLFRTLGEAIEVFGEEPTLGLTRVIGTSLATIADAATSTFLINVDLPQRDPLVGESYTNPESIGIAEELVTQLCQAVDVVLRRHLLEARRTTDVNVKKGFELQETAVGFADLVGSTRLAEEVELTRLGRLLMMFEETVRSIVTNNGARTVKLIGDEVMFAATDPQVIVRIGTEIAVAIAGNPDLPDVRVGVAAGETLHRDGDLFGPIVNLAARLAKHAQPGTVLVAHATTVGLDEAFSCGTPTDYLVAGFEEPVAATVVSLAPNS